MTAEETEGISGLLEVSESVSSKDLVVSNVTDGSATGRVVCSSSHETAGECERIRGFRVSGPSLCMSTNSSNSSGCVDAVDASAPASLAVVAHARSTPTHVVHNSCSDTGRVTGPTGGSGSKGGVSDPA